MIYINHGYMKKDLSEQPSKDALDAALYDWAERIALDHPCEYQSKGSEDGAGLLQLCSWFPHLADDK